MQTKKLGSPHPPNNLKKSIILFSEHLHHFKVEYIQINFFRKQKLSPRSCFVYSFKSWGMVRKIDVLSNRESEWVSHLTLCPPPRSLGLNRSHPPPSFQNVPRLHGTSPLSPFFFSGQFLPSVCHSHTFFLFGLSDLSCSLSLSPSVPRSFALLRCPHFTQPPVHNVATAWHLGTIAVVAVIDCNCSVSEWHICLMAWPPVPSDWPIISDPLCFFVHPSTHPQE